MSKNNKITENNININVTAGRIYPFIYCTIVKKNPQYIVDCRRSLDQLTKPLGRMEVQNLEEREKNYWLRLKNAGDCFVTILIEFEFFGVRS